MTEIELHQSPLVAEPPLVDEGAPALPIIPHLAKAVENVNFAKGQLDLFLLILDGAPREQRALYNALVAAQRHIEDVAAHYLAAVEVAGCRGQA